MSSSSAGFDVVYTNIAPLITRTYESGHVHQWVREMSKNSLEARATWVRFVVEEQALEHLGVSRMVIADDGDGMDAEELYEFFGSLGVGAKPIGDANENFGIGGKVSTLPWNKYGVVVLSRKDGEEAMIWIEWNDVKANWRLRAEEVEGNGNTTYEAFYAPYDGTDEGEVDWEQVLHDHLGDSEHGTVVVLLGDTPSTDTLYGDVQRSDTGKFPEAYIVEYLNSRYWNTPEGTTIWATMPGSKHEDGRSIKGAEQIILNYNGESGVVDLGDGAVARWYLAPESAKMGAGRQRAEYPYGYIALIYQGEVFELTRHHNRYSAFGIRDKEIRERTFILVDPLEYESKTMERVPGYTYVKPHDSRNGIHAFGHDGLPWDEWAETFANNMPQAILDAGQKLTPEIEEDEGTNNLLRSLLSEFAKSWRVSILRPQSEGADKVDDSSEHDFLTERDGLDMPHPPRRKVRRPVKKRRQRTTKDAETGKVGVDDGKVPAKRSSIVGGLPEFNYINRDDLDPDEFGLIIKYHKQHTGQNARIDLVQDHPAVVAYIRKHQDMYPASRHDEVRKMVCEAIFHMVACNVAHSTTLGSHLGINLVPMQENVALSTVVLGSLQVESIMKVRSPKLGKKLV